MIRYRVKNLNAIKHYFNSEFRNKLKLNVMIQFNDLNNAIIVKIFDKFIRKLCDHLRENKITLNLVLSLI